MAKKSYRDMDQQRSHNGIDVVETLPEHGKPRFRKGQVVKDRASDWIGTIIHPYRTNRDQWEYSIQWEDSRDGHMWRSIIDWPEQTLEETTQKIRPRKHEGTGISNKAALRVPRPPTNKRGKKKPAPQPEMTDEEGRALACAVLDALGYDEKRFRTIESLTRLGECQCHVEPSN